MGNRKNQVSADVLIASDPTLKLVHGGVLPNTYGTTFTAVDFTSDSDIPNKGAVMAWIGSSNQTTLPKIPANTATPFNIIMNTTYASFGPNPTFIFKIPKPGDMTGTKLQEFSDIYAVSNYSDNTFSTLVSIDVYGHDNGSGLFAEDTYITLKV